MLQRKEMLYGELIIKNKICQTSLNRKITVTKTPTKLCVFEKQQWQL